MTPLPIEQDLRDALSVEPSRSFAAGVRARIEAQSAPIDASLRWPWMTAACAVAAMALIVWLRPSRAALVPTPAPLAPLAARSVVSTPALPSSTSSFARQNTANVEVVRPRPLREPEILISPSESRALLKLIAGPRTWQIDPLPVVVSTAPPVTDLVVEPIVIAPLSVDSGQGVRQ